MIQFFQKRMNKKGFTLVELLIVIAVLGIIAAIAVPRMAGVTDQVKIKADKEAAKLAARNIEYRVLSGAIDKKFLTVDGLQVVSGDSTANNPGYGETLPEIQQTSADDTMYITISKPANSDTVTVTIMTASDGDNIIDPITFDLID